MIVRCRDLIQAGGSERLHLIESGRTIGLHALLTYAGELLKDNYLPSSDIDVLIEILPELFDTNDYSRIKPNSQEAVTASSIREACVKLAWNIINIRPNANIEAMIEKAKNDPLPEVRFSAANPQPSLFE